jgi:hypothetical protein
MKYSKEQNVSAYLLLGLMYPHSTKAVCVLRLITLGDDS